MKVFVPANLTMDLNTATLDEMQRLIGICDGRAQANFEGRAILSRSWTLLELLEIGIPADVVKALVGDLNINAIPRHEEQDGGMGTIKYFLVGCTLYGRKRKMERGCKGSERWHGGISNNKRIPHEK